MRLRETSVFLVVNNYARGFVVESLQSLCLLSRFNIVFSVLLKNYIASKLISSVIVFHLLKKYIF